MPRKAQLLQSWNRISSLVSSVKNARNTHVLQRHVSMFSAGLRRRNRDPNSVNELIKANLVCWDLLQYSWEYLDNCDWWSQYVDHGRISYHLHAILAHRERFVDEQWFHFDQDYRSLVPLLKMDSLDAPTDWWCRLQRQEHFKFTRLSSLGIRRGQTTNYMKIPIVWSDCLFLSMAISRRSWWKICNRQCRTDSMGVDDVILFCE